MLLSKNKILEHIEKGNIFIHPFDKRNIRTRLKTTSYDVTLGGNFFRETPFKTSEIRVFNPFDPSHIKKYWGEPQKAIIAKSWTKKYGPLKNIRPSDKIIILEPGETILAHTIEFIGGRNCIGTEMRARSSMGRIGITVCKCAGWGDLGFCNRWTMEMTNHLKGTPVLLLVGMRVAQIIFYETDPLNETYSKTGGSYQTTDDTEEMIKNWDSCLMLPKFNRKNP